MKGLFYFVAAAAAGVLVMGGLAVAKAQKWIKQITVKFIAVGKPSASLKSQYISIPVQLEISNPSPVPVPVQNLKVKFFVRKGSDYVEAGHTAALGAFTFAPGINTLVANPTIDLKALNFTENFNLDNFLSTLATGALADIRLDLEITVAFIPFTIPVYTQIRYDKILS